MKQRIFYPRGKSNLVKEIARFHNVEVVMELKVMFPQAKSLFGMPVLIETKKVHKCQFTSVQ